MKIQKFNFENSEIIQIYINNIEINDEKILNDLEEQYTHNKEKWINEIYKKVIKE